MFPSNIQKQAMATFKETFFFTNTTFLYRLWFWKFSGYGAFFKNCAQVLARQTHKDSLSRLTKRIWDSDKLWLKAIRNNFKPDIRYPVSVNCQIFHVLVAYIVSYPPNPHVFEPPGSGSICQRYGSGSFYHPSLTSKNSKENLGSYCFVTSCCLFMCLFIFEKWCKCTF